ncbi:hypothetical protein [Listeria booriae]|uniref:hypothetical protein n=1 Tax=Listeria booriae TaxID=1552123 RepID=UPI001624819D|nr:hypothetical protein [Listeria booriae]MBC1800795.1 hypothetical protein [Listeria booriae]MBC1803763.1 hypothetical protein [Listeria booriae]
MSEEILLREMLKEKNVTFLFGAGASAPFFSSLGNFENLLTNDNINVDGKNLIKAIFFEQSIKDNSYIQNYLDKKCYCGEKAESMDNILGEYTRFIHNILEYLKYRNSRVSPKRANIITTNYDLFFEAAIDDTLYKNSRIFFNDGTNGYTRKILNTDNFNKTLLFSGVFDNYSNEIPALNLIKCHGSVNWVELPATADAKSCIQVLTRSTILKQNEDIDTLLRNINNSIGRIKSDLKTDVNSYAELLQLMQEDITNELVADINMIASQVISDLTITSDSMEQMQIVFPTKKKFEHTLIQEHFFSMLRLLSYELEKKQSALIVFGFSFYDEHITEVVQRSLNNPSLLVIIVCYMNTNKSDIISKFNFFHNSVPKNIHFIGPENFLVEEISIPEYEEKYRNTKLENYFKFFDDGDTKKVYTDIVDTLVDKNGIMHPILNFSSFNKILEEDIINKYKPEILEANDNGNK